MLGQVSAGDRAPDYLCLDDVDEDIVTLEQDFDEPDEPSHRIETPGSGAVGGGGGAAAAGSEAADDDCEGGQDAGARGHVSCR